MTSMEKENYSNLSIDQPVQYQIRIKGELEERWSNRMGGMQINQQAQKDGLIVTTLEGQLIDQAALFGVLVALYNMRLPLISVERIDLTREEPNPLMKVRVKQNADFLEFIVTGVQKNLELPDSLETILNSCKLAGVDCALVDFRGLIGGNRDDPEVGYDRGADQIYKKYLAAGNLPLNIAVLEKKEMIHAWKQREEILRSYGLETLITDDYNEAITWLNSKTPP